MQKIALRCDICNGPLTMQSGGKMAVCDYCGTQYALERLREKIQEIRGKVSIEGTVKTAYEDFEIHAGVLTKYHGADTDIVIPSNVKEIASDCFGNNRQHITSVALPDGLQQINNGTFAGCTSLNSIVLPRTVTQIDNNAFKGCMSLKKMTLPKGITRIGYSAFNTCTSLAIINIPDSIVEIAVGAFWNCTNLKMVIISNETFQRLCPEIAEDKHERYNEWRGNVYSHSTYFWEWPAFSSDYFPNSNKYCKIKIGFPNNRIDVPSAIYRLDYANALETTSIWFRELVPEKFQAIKAMSQENWRKQKRCQHCGGEFDFFVMCRRCRKLKDY